MTTRKEDFPEIRTFEEIPSPADFESCIELNNVPAVMRGCVMDWEACSNWNPSNGGLDYLEERVGSLTVEGMLSRSAPVFYGDLRSHERVPLPFSDFIGYCRQHKLKKDVSGFKLERHDSVVCDEVHNPLCLEDVVVGQMYLAQVPIINVDNEEKIQLKVLQEDIKTPNFLGMKLLSSVNLWMNSAQVRSSTHYDPHHNLLCVLAGCKQGFLTESMCRVIKFTRIGMTHEPLKLNILRIRFLGHAFNQLSLASSSNVILWPPNASPMLYPMPIYGESSNHSSVALEKPDFSVCPRAEQLMEYSQKVVLQAGDALFIPEGWFHQVDSEELTIAVNFWWQSKMMSNMSEHMDSYYLRRIIRRLTDKEMKQMLPKNSSTGSERLQEDMHKQTSRADLKVDQVSDENNLKGLGKLQGTSMHELGPCALQALHVIVSIVHERVNVSDRSQSVQSSSPSSSPAANKNSSILTAKLYRIQDDPIASTLWTLEPSTLKNVLLSLAHNFPRTLEALMLHLLSPVAAEILTQKFDELDQQISEEERNQFYQEFYTIFDDQFAAMDAILNGKESFAFQAFKNVLDKYLGVSPESAKP